MTRDGCYSRVISNNGRKHGISKVSGNGPGKAATSGRRPPSPSLRRPFRVLLGWGGGAGRFTDVYYVTVKAGGVASGP